MTARRYLPSDARGQEARGKWMEVVRVVRPHQALRWLVHLTYSHIDQGGTGDRAITASANQ